MKKINLPENIHHLANVYTITKSNKTCPGIAGGFISSLLLSFQPLQHRFFCSCSAYLLFFVLFLQHIIVSLVI